MESRTALGGLEGFKLDQIYTLSASLTLPGAHNELPDQIRAILSHVEALIQTLEFISRGLGGLKLDEIDVANSFLMLLMARNLLR